MLQVGQAGARVYAGRGLRAVHVPLHLRRGEPTAPPSIPRQKTRFCAFPSTLCQNMRFFVSIYLEDA